MEPNNKQQEEQQGAGAAVAAEVANEQATEIEQVPGEEKESEEEGTPEG